VSQFVLPRLPNTLASAERRGGSSSTTVFRRPCWYRRWWAAYGMHVRRHGENSWLLHCMFSPCGRPKNFDSPAAVYSDGQSHPWYTPMVRVTRGRTFSTTTSHHIICSDYVHCQINVTATAHWCKNLSFSFTRLARLPCVHAHLSAHVKTATTCSQAYEDKYHNFSTMLMAQLGTSLVACVLLWLVSALTLQLVKHDGGSDVTVCRCSSAVGFIRQLT
jgi:hypothetical protein